MSASGGFGPLSASAKTDIQSEIHNASASGRVQVNVTATGGAGLGGLGDLVKSLSTQANSFPAIEGSLGD